MNNIRKIKKVTKGRPAVDGAGVHLVRVVGYNDVKDYDPFLLLDAFDSTNPDDYIKGFPWHPHRGIETVTYLIEGKIEHGDSLGNSGSILDGDCQWMTAGSGIIHQEMPQASSRILGAQLWLNLPKKDKMCPPKYGDILSKDVPIITENNTKIHIISGIYKDTKGAFEGSYVKAMYLDVEMKSNDKWSLSIPSEDTLFIYIVQGEGSILNDKVYEKSAILLDKGELFEIKSQLSDLRFLLFSATPLKEDIAWGGPIVMNTKEELDFAFKELRDGTFIKE